MKAAFCTVLTESPERIKEHYRCAFLTMLYSLKKHGAVDGMDFHVYTGGVSHRTFEIAKAIWPGIVFLSVGSAPYMRTRDKHNARYWSFEAFRLNYYDRVVFLDSDLFCRGNVRTLLDYDCDIGMVREKRRDCFNAGVITIGKNVLGEKTFSELLAHEAPDHIFGNDQKIYNSYFSGKITELPAKYNTLVTEYEGDDPVFLHYIHKPYVAQGRENLSPELAGIWFDMYFEMEQRFGGDLCCL